MQLFVYEGALTLILDDEEKHVVAGEFYMFASRQSHGYRNEGDVAVCFVRTVVI